MDRRLATALACSLALHALLVALLPIGVGSTQESHGKGRLSVYLQPAAPLAASAAASRHDSPPPLPPASIDPAAGSAGKAYLLPGEIDERAYPIRLAALIYPEQAYQMRTRGIVKLRIYINESGKIDAVDVISANPPGVFEEAALQALLATPFMPAKKNGRTVKSQKLIEIKFDPYEAANQP